MSGLSTIRQAFANRNYLLYVCGNLTSTSGNWVQRVAMGWLTWELTHSGAWLGIIAFADLFPTFLIGLFAGALTDRSDALKVLRVTQGFAIVQAAALAAITFAGAATEYWLLAFALMRGVIVAFNRPSRMTLVYNIVGRDTLATAIAINSMIFNSTRFIGPALGGAIVAWWGPQWAFVYNAFSYAVFVAVLFAMDVAIERRRPKERRSLMAESWEGVTYAFGHPGIGLALVILLLTALFVRPFTELLPGFAADVFGRGVNAYATLLAFHGAGAIAGGYWMAQRGGVQGLARLTVFNLLVMAVSLIVFATAANFWVALPIMAITGWAFVVQGIAIQSLVQIATSSALRGRVMACYGIVARGGPALGALAMGGLSAFFGLPAPVAGGAILCVALWAWATTRRRQLRDALERESIRRTTGRETPAGAEGG